MISVTFPHPSSPKFSERFSGSYSTLKPRITRALLRAYLDNKKPFTTHYGAIIGLTITGREVVRTLLLPNLKIYADMVLQPAFSDDGDISQRDDAEKVLEAIIVFVFLRVFADWVESFECFSCGGYGVDGG